MQSYNNDNKNSYECSSKLEDELCESDSDDRPWKKWCGPWTKEEDMYRRRLKYFFMNPYEKFKARKKVPWKLILQIFKLFIVTYQLIDFGYIRSQHIDFIEMTNLAIKHLYLKDWSLSYETMPYPPSLGKMAAYTLQDFYNNVDFTLNRYNSTEDIAIGNFNYASFNNTKSNILMCVNQFKVGLIYAFNESFVFDSRTDTDCFPILPIKSSKQILEYNIEKYLESINKSILFDRLISVTIKFSLKTVHLISLRRSQDPDCFQFNIEIRYDNSQHNGQLEIILSSKIKNLVCNGKVLYEDTDIETILSWLFDAVILIICALSAFLCLRSFSRAVALMKASKKFFFVYYPDRKLKQHDCFDFLDFWYLLIILNDTLTFSGCVCKILIETKINTNYELCGILLGTGSLFAWFGVLRYLALFKSFNVLIKTMKKAFPDVIKFLVCAFFIFLGFSICGWIVLGPYHIKFRQLATSLECLYSLINGDDIYTTFATMNQVSWGVWIFSRLYLYIFISLFIYVILSMFITIIADTYDTIKHPHGYNMTKSRLQLFAEECCHLPTNKLFCKPIETEIMTHLETFEEHINSSIEINSSIGSANQRNILLRNEKPCKICNIVSYFRVNKCYFCSIIDHRSKNDLNLRNGNLHQILLNRNNATINNENSPLLVDLREDQPVYDEQVMGPLLRT